MLLCAPRDIRVLHRRRRETSGFAGAVCHTACMNRNASKDAVYRLSLHFEISVRGGRRSSGTSFSTSFHLRPYRIFLRINKKRFCCLDRASPRIGACDRPTPSKICPFSPDFFLLEKNCFFLKKCLHFGFDKVILYYNNKWAAVICGSVSF